MSAYEEFAKRAYGDLADPNWAFNASVLHRKPFAAEVGQLEAHYRLEEWTDYNYDVAFRYRLFPKRSSDFVNAELWLSAVAPYAVFLVDTTEYARTEVVTPGRPGAGSLVATTLNTVVTWGFRFLSVDELERPMDVAIFDDPDVRVAVWHVFFCNLEVFPWVAPIDPSE